MSTNYYFKFYGASLSIDSKVEKEKSFSRLIEEMEATLNELNHIHIGKRSVGWKPVFQKTEFYSTVKELEQFYKDNERVLAIVDEYGNEFTFEGLKSALMDWNKDQNGAKGHLEIISSFFTYKDEDGYEFLDTNFG